MRRFNGDIRTVAKYLELTTRSVHLKLNQFDIEPKKYRIKNREMTARVWDGGILGIAFIARFGSLTPHAFPVQARQAVIKAA